MTPSRSRSTAILSAPGLEHLAQLADLAQLGRIVLEDEGSALRPDLDQPLGLQPQECLADRRAADAELLGKRLLGKLLAEPELVGDDQVADLLDDDRAPAIAAARCA